MITIEQAIAYDTKYPIIWISFQAETLVHLKKGRTHLSAKGIFEILRSTYKELATSEKFKLNNNYSAYYARRFMEKHPKYGNIFELRNSLFDNLPPSNQYKLEL